MAMVPNTSSSDLTRTLADEVAAYLEIKDHLAAITWFLEGSELDLGTTLTEAARHLRLAIAACERERLA